MKYQYVLTDEERFPAIDNLSYLQSLRQDNCAPLFNFKSGDRLDQIRLEEVKKYRNQLNTMTFQTSGAAPQWLQSFLDWCRKTVPAYRGYPFSFQEMTTLRRDQLAATPWKFVSDDCKIEDLIVYDTSGSTGAPMDVLFNAVAQACWLPQLESILSNDGITLPTGTERAAICLVCDQKNTLTYASLSTYLDGAGILKINLNEKDWKSPDDRLKFLEKHNPAVLTGDPIAFTSLLQLKPALTPAAIVSSAMALSEGLRQKLTDQFKCPVYDIYSLTECRMIGVSRQAGRHRLIRPELYIEIMHPEQDTVLADGERGEIVITGGNNPFLPLIRYRTGDFGALIYTENGGEIAGLEGRSPVKFRDAMGRKVNSIDISQALGAFSLAAFTLHQNSDGSIVFSAWGTDIAEEDVRKSLSKIFGEQIKKKIGLNESEIPQTKKVRYSSDIEKT